MAKPSKRTSQQAKKKTTPEPSSNTTPTTAPPVPFTPSPEALHPFLSTLSKSEFYITHVDSHPPPFKRQVFIVPIIINILITALAIYRAYDGLKTYPAIISATFGPPDPTNPEAINTSTSTWLEITYLIIRRFSKFIIDYLIFTLLLPWPVRLVLGPIKWRRSIGYRDHEIIVRKSRSKWSHPLLEESHNRWIKGMGANAAETINFTRDRVMPAMAPERVAKTGYLLVDADWDLDFQGMVTAHSLVDAATAATAAAASEESESDDDATIQLSDFRTALHIHESGPNGRGWLTWRIDPDNLKPDPSPTPATSDPPTDYEEEETRRQTAQREKIVAFKDKLTTMGKENLFYRWVELIQYESTREGGFTVERQEEAMRQAKEMFEEQGVDFAGFWREVGGMEGLPGFES